MEDERCNGSIIASLISGSRGEAGGYSVSCRGIAMSRFDGGTDTAKSDGGNGMGVTALGR